ncbi:MAG: S-adenosylmethionine:tRNA ribosyltransferase-isomerase [Chloroflexota bacterium]
MITLQRELAFTVPPELEAHEPAEVRGLARDDVRLLVTGRRGEHTVHAHFRQFPRFLRPGDLVVLNDSATLPAALTATLPGGDTVAVHLSTHQGGDRWVLEVRPAQATLGDVLTLPGDGRAVLLAPYRRSKRLWLAHLDLPDPVPAHLQRWGKPITYSYLYSEWPIGMYQTVYAAQPGSAEMPSAGRPFTTATLNRLQANGVGVAMLTLHTGVSSLESGELPYPEPFAVPEATAAAVNATHHCGGRVIAVGTTVVRALESAVNTTGAVVATRGWTELVVTPERGVRAVDGLLTGFHEPQATHLAMLAAIADRDALQGAYQAAIAGGYLWHEFGDVHLIL